MDYITKHMIIAGAAYTIVGMGIGHSIANKIPTVEQSNFQPGYINPSELEIKLQDLDNNGKKEVQMNYGGKSYMLQLDGQGKPTVVSYDMEAAQIVPK